MSETTRFRLPETLQPSATSAWDLDPTPTARLAPRPSTLPLTRWTFETVTVDAAGREQRRDRYENAYYREVLGDRAPLDLVAVPGGRFRMGAAPGEANAARRESPARSVRVAPFFLSKYPITQIQWRAVAALPQVKRPLPPQPASFRSDARPVETVSWHDAVEFCDRLSLKTGRLYRLPSEAEWEYACRAGTTTPYACGSTLTTNLANYDGRTTYAQARPGRFRDRTTVVGSFLPNRFGLYDLHGNVWEWCADVWHTDYYNAPDDSRIWNDGGDPTTRPLRGGSWLYFPGYCRSAARIHYAPDFRSYNVGFRVACSA